MATPQAQCPLIDLPLEILNTIILLTYPEKWSGRTPPIIKALRPLPTLYQQALSLFDKRNYSYILYEDNAWGLSDMPPPVISTIHSVTIALRLPFLYASHDDNDPRTVRLRAASEALTSVTAVRVVHDGMDPDERAHSDSRSYRGDFCRLFPFLWPGCVRWFTGLKVLAVAIPGSGAWCWGGGRWSHVLGLERRDHKSIERLDYVLGVVGRLRVQEGWTAEEEGGPCAGEWVWEAEEGGVLERVTRKGLYMVEGIYQMPQRDLP